MPVTFNDVSSLPDALSTDRHLIFFPSRNGIRGDVLSKSYSSATLPPTGSAHVITKLFGFSIGHAGNQQFENQMSITFHENAEGLVTKSLKNWMKLVRDDETGLSQGKNFYAVDLPVFIYGPTKDKALEYKALNAFPLTIEPSELNEDSGPYTITAQFSCDGLDLVQ